MRDVQLLDSRQGSLSLIVQETSTEGLSHSDSLLVETNGLVRGRCCHSTAWIWLVQVHRLWIDLITSESI